MYEIWSQVVEHLRGGWRFRWRALLMAWVVAFAGWAWVYSLPDIYSASARVHVDTKSNLRPLLTGIVASNVLDQVALMTRVLLSRPQLERVAKETDLHLQAETPQDMERIVDRLKLQIRISQDSRNSIYTIEYQDRDRERAQNVVRVLLDSFVEDSLGANREKSSDAQRFLEAQIAEYERVLSEAEQRLANFKKQHVGMMPGDQGGYYERLQAALTQQEQLRSDLRLAQNRRDQLERQIDGEEAVFGLFTPPSGAGVGGASQDPQIAEYERQLTDLQLRFTDKHPDIVALQETIERLEAQRPTTADAGGSSGPASGLSMNPVYQDMRIALSRADLEVTTLRGRLADQQQRVSSLREAVDTVPEVEAELVRLNRDYEVNKAQHEQLMQALRTARLSEQAEQTDDITFQELDPPVATLMPVGPNRPLFLTVVLVAALGAGAGLAFFQHQLSPVFSTRRSLAELTGRPVLGTVTLIETPQQRRRVRTQSAAFAAGVLTLGLAYGVTILFMSSGVRLVQSLLGAGQL